MHPLFTDRRHAGQVLAKLVASRPVGREALVLGLPRGGLVVAAEVAQRVGLPLDVFVVRKLGAPGQPELAIGAIASGGVRVVNDEYVRALGIDQHELDAITREQTAELRRREAVYRDRQLPEVAGRRVIVVDDGLATGATMRAAVEALRMMGASGLMVAVPVGAGDVVQQFRDADVDVVCAASPEPFHGVGRWYEDFPQTTDEEVREALDHAQVDNLRPR